MTPDPEGKADEGIIPAVDDSCNCTQSGGVCLPSNLGIGDRFTPSSNDEIVKFTTDEVHSAFFKEHVKVAAYMCYVRKTALPGLHETNATFYSVTRTQRRASSWETSALSLCTTKRTRPARSSTL